MKNENFERLFTPQTRSARAWNFDKTYEALAVWGSFDIKKVPVPVVVVKPPVEVVAPLAKKEDVKLKKNLFGTPDWINSYTIEHWKSWMSWAIIDLWKLGLGQKSLVNYITIHSDWDLFPITDREVFCTGYKKKYWKRPKMVLSWPRTKNKKLLRPVVTHLTEDLTKNTSMSFIRFVNIFETLFPAEV